MSNNDQSRISYTEGADGILYPDLEFSTVPETKLGKYGSLRMEYLKNHKKGLYSKLANDCQLMEHLAEVDQRAYEMMDRLEAEYRQANPAPDTEDFLTTVQYNNQARQYAEEIVLTEVVYQ